MNQTVIKQLSGSCQANVSQLSGSCQAIVIVFRHTVWTVNDVLSQSTPFFAKGCQKGMDRLKSKGMDRLNKRVWIDSKRH